MNVIGIDPGAHTGVAYFEAGKLVRPICLRFAQEALHLEASHA